MTNPQYGQVYFECKCGKNIGGTVLVDQKFSFTCLGCGVVSTGILTNSQVTFDSAPVSSVSVGLQYFRNPQPLE